MSQIYNIHMVITEDDSGVALATRTARVFTGDLATGKRMVGQKADEIWKDFFHVMPVVGTA